MKKKQSRDNELKELLKENPDILMEFLEDWKEACEIEEKDKIKKISLVRESIISTGGGFTEEQLDFLETIT
jgi:hypothetical protein